MSSTRIAAAPLGLGPQPPSTYPVRAPHPGPGPFSSTAISTPLCVPRGMPSRVSSGSQRLPTSTPPFLSQKLDQLDWDLQPPTPKKMTAIRICEKIFFFVCVGLSHNGWPASSIEKGNSCSWETRVSPFPPSCRPHSRGRTCVQMTRPPPIPFPRTSRHH